MLGETTMIRTTRSSLTLSLFAATALTLGLLGSASAQQSVEVHHKTVKVGDLDIFYRARRDWGGVAQNLTRSFVGKFCGGVVPGFSIYQYCRTSVLPGSGGVDGIA